MTDFSRRTFLSSAGLALAGGALASPASFGAATPQVPAALDHILLGISDLDHGIAFVEEHTGVRAAFGGVHPGRGTRNALLRLGTRRYLEIIAPDPQQATLAAYPELRDMREPHLLTWALHTDDISAVEKKLTAEHIAIEGPEAGSRARPDGKVLHWKALRLKDDRGGLLPFFIEWGRDSVHPSIDAPSGCHIASFSAEGPKPKQLRETFALVGVDVIVRAAEKPQLRARIEGPKGALELTS